MMMGAELKDMPGSADIGVMSLNVDVLFEIMRSCTQDKSTLSRLMRTCHLLYTKGVPLLLGSQITIRSRQLFSFCQFMKVDINHRSQLIRSINFTFCQLEHTIDATPEELATILLMLENATNLKRLRLDNATLKSDDRLPMTIAALKTIEELELDTFGPQAESMLITLKSPIRAMTVSFVDAEGKPLETYQPTPSFIEAFKTFRETLEEITVSSAHWTSPWSGPTVDVSFTKVTSLKLLDWNDVEGEPLMVAFPNLRKLHARREDIFSVDTHDFFRGAGDVGSLRQLKIEAQNRNSVSWPFLDELSGEYLYCFAILCPVRELSVSMKEIT
ncbi:hypothetical protein BC835DRAFT_410979 [Cytidiella melzeri]|nr:hypothetical protein BC835DRAFT_410979 [Cytidiella melzeri]